MPDRGGGADRPRRRVGADVLHVIDLGGQRCVPSSSNAMRTVAVLVAGLARRDQVLPAVLDPLERGRQLAGGEHEAHVLALDGTTF